MIGGDLWVVWSFEHQAWWKPGKWGYTPDLSAAGRYSEAEARAIEHKANRYSKVIEERALPLSDALRDGPPKGA